MNDKHDNLSDDEKAILDAEQAQYEAMLEWEKTLLANLETEGLRSRLMARTDEEALADIKNFFKK